MVGQVLASSFRRSCFLILGPCCVVPVSTAPSGQDPERPGARHIHDLLLDGAWAPPGAVVEGKKGAGKGKARRQAAGAEAPARRAH